MALEADEVKQLEERFEALENKLRATFLEVEKRFAAAKAQPVEIEDRIQELEDLILLMQLEITKIKDRTSVTTEFLTPQTPDVVTRIGRLEEALSMKAAEKEAPPGEGEEQLFGGEAVEETPEPAARPRARAAEAEEKEEREEKPTKSLLEEVQKILSS